MSPMEQYLARCRALVAVVENQREAIGRVTDRFAQTILAGRIVQVFGSGHGRIMVEEMWPRYGSFPGFNPLMELSLSFHHPVVGSNGQRQAIFLENVPGPAARILRNFDLSTEDGRANSLRQPTTNMGDAWRNCMPRWANRTTAPGKTQSMWRPNSFAGAFER
jgi:hypothetical protein